MLNVPPRTFIRRRRASREKTPPSVALTLVEASFDEGAPSVRLVFDRAIDIAGLAGAQIVVDAGNVTGTRYEAVGEANLDSPDAVVIGLLEVGPSSSVDTLLTASAGTGIVAVEGGGTWAGVTELALPFP
jgi:hypothetical protein